MNYYDDLHVSIILLLLSNPIENLKKGAILNNNWPVPVAISIYLFLCNVLERISLIILLVYAGLYWEYLIPWF